MSIRREKKVFYGACVIDSILSQLSFIHPILCNTVLWTQLATDPETDLTQPDTGYPSHELTNREHSPEDLRTFKETLNESISRWNEANLESL